MTILIAGIAYMAVCFMVRGAGSWSPRFLPHCASASSPQFALLTILPTMLLILGAFVGSSFVEKGWWVVEASVLALLISLILDALRRALTSQPQNLTRTTTPSLGEKESPATSPESSDDHPPLILLSAPEHELIKMEADFRLSSMMGKTPFRETRLASTEALGIILENYPSVAVVPWLEILNEKIFSPHVETAASCKEKIAEALASETAKMATEMENSELQSKLGEALEANRKYEKVLQDLRSRPTNTITDYTKMTPSQRQEEERKLKESLGKLQELSKNPALPQVNIPSYFKQPGSIS
jgi:hypothetical protein